jgi:subtilisin family serine protease
VAGIAGAQRTDNAVGMTGIAYNANVVPVRVLGHCGGYDTDIGAVGYAARVVRFLPGYLLVAVLYAGGAVLATRAVTRILASVGR